MPSPIKSRSPRFIARVLSPLCRDERGGIAVTFAMLFIPLMLVMGFAVDYARMVQYRSALQNAVDQAAIAGAAAFSGPNGGPAAAQIATNYFNRTILPASLSINGPTVTTSNNGTINPALGNSPAYTVTVKATATVGTTLLSLIIPSASIMATGTAGDPVVLPQLNFTHVNSRACDGNSVYLYKVPLKSNGSGYDYSAVPAWTSTNGLLDNYYMIGSSYLAAPTGQVLPSMTATQPLGIALVNVTNGNAGTGNTSCGASVTGANSYGAPHMNSQTFYSSYLLNGQSPSETANNTPYTVQVSTSYRGNSSTIYAVNNLTAGVPVPIQSGSYNNLTSYLGINGNSSTSNCSTSVVSTTQSGSTTYQTVNYTCNTQYLTTKTSNQPNCSLYVQTGVTQSYLDGLTNNTSAPTAAQGNCFSVTGGGASYAAPSCAQLSALSNSSSSSAVAPAAVFWWDDAGGVGQNEQYYSPSSHCSATSSGGPGYGEDCLYKNNFFGTKCTVTGGSGSGYTEVVLTQ